MVEAIRKYVGIDFDAISDDAEAVTTVKAVEVELADATEKTWGNSLYARFMKQVEQRECSNDEIEMLNEDFLNVLE